MEIKFTKTAGSDDFHQDLVDILSIKYQTIGILLFEIIENGTDLFVNRSDKDGVILFSISIIDLKNEIITIDWVGIGG